MSTEDALVAVLEQEAGFTVQATADQVCLSLRRLTIGRDEGKFELLLRYMPDEGQRTQKGACEVFEEARVAVRSFERQRQELCVGADT